jgi:predicted double-glycine peptidase
MRFFSVLLALLPFVTFVTARQSRKSGQARAKVGNYPNPLPPQSLPKDAVMMPLMRQGTYYTCGVASLQSCLVYWQVYDHPEQFLAEQCGTTEEQGTPPENIVSVAQSYNLTAYMKEKSTLEDVQAAVKDGFTVMLDVQAWTYDDPTTLDWSQDWEDGHYVVFVGMDDKFVFIMDPSTAGTYGYVPREQFLSRWHDYEQLADGSRREYYQLAIFIKGSNPWVPYPHDITYMG